MAVLVDRGVSIVWWGLLSKARDLVEVQFEGKSLLVADPGVDQALVLGREARSLGLGCHLRRSSEGKEH